MKRRDGFTVIELLISTAVMGLVITYVLGAFATQQRNYVVTDQVTEAQQNLRAIGELLEREIRLAGFLVAEHAAACGTDNTAGPDVLYLSDAEPLDPTAVKTADLGAKIVGGVPLAGTVVFALDGADDLVLDGNAFYDNSGDGVADTDFRCDGGNCAAATSVAGGVIVIDVANPARGAACGRITRIVGTTSLTAVMTGPLLAWNASMNAADLRLVPAHRYEVVPDPVTAVPQLRRDGLVLANDVDDLQVAWFLDTNDDGREDPGEYLGIGGGTPYTPLRDHTFLRELRANVVVRTRAQDDRLSEGQGQRMENRAGATPQDGFRRRVHTATVRPRNVGVRG